MVLSGGSKKPFEKIVPIIKMEPRDEDLIEAYKVSDPNKMIWHENFKENTRQWKIAYDPYKTL